MGYDKFEMTFIYNKGKQLLFFETFGISDDCKISMFPICEI